jgi:uncharacterized damage-inducible protein DinB
MDTALISETYEYNRWADERFIAAAQRLPAEMFTRTLGGSYPSVRDTLAHIFGSAWIWMERWQGNSPARMPAGADFPDLGRLSREWAQLHRRQREFIARLDDAALQQPVSYINLKGQRFAYPLWQQMMHVVNHSSYHRGQVTNMFRQMNVEPVATDLLIYYDER